MITCYGLAYITQGNSFHRCYGVFFLDEGGVIQPLDIGDIPDNATHLGRLIAQYQMDNENKIPKPISLGRPNDFPTTAQLGSAFNNSKVPAIFSELTIKELRQATTSLEKTLKGEYFKGI